MEDTFVKRTFAFAPETSCGFKPPELNWDAGEAHRPSDGFFSLYGVRSTEYGVVWTG